MRSRIAIFGGLTALAVLLQASPCAADALPDVTPGAGGYFSAAGIVPIAWVGLGFVLVVSGVSFLLLRRVARKRREDTPPAETPGAPDED
jgi:hypothetical protein